MSRSKRLQKGFAGVITGASSGIGKALAVRLAKRYGAKLVVNARSEKALQETCALIEKNGGSAIAIAGDVSDVELTGSLIKTCKDKFGDLDLLVNNAGLAKPGAITRLTPEDWRDVFEVNFFAPLTAIYAALPYFLPKRSGKIVNVSSVASKVSFPGSVCYAASKFALTGMSEGMAAEFSRLGVDVITVCPGWVRTEFFKKNFVPDSHSPTLIAQKNDISGLLMRHVLSISSEACADDIIKALDRGGSSELVMTIPGVAVERLKALFPTAVLSLTQLVPLPYDDAVDRPERVSAD
jgi:NAD(P)-dependent dehydrogenase (short-subunit alcohol dehydrogenase family)